MAIGVRSATATVTQVTTTATTWASIAMPTGWAAGDFVVLGIGNNVGSTASTPATTGWTAFKVDESSGLKGSFMYRLMQAGDPSTISITWGATTTGLVAAMAFTGVDATTPVDAAPVGQAEASASAIAAHVTPSITVVTAGAALLTLFTTDVAATWTGTDTENADVTAGGTSTAFYHNLSVSAGATTRTGTASATSVKAVSLAMALRPAAVAAAVNPPRPRFNRTAVMRSAVM